MLGVGYHHIHQEQVWKLRLSLLQSAAYLLILSTSLLRAAAVAKGFGFAPPTLENVFAIGMSTARAEPLHKAVDDEVRAPLVFLIR